MDECSILVLKLKHNWGFFSAAETKSKYEILMSCFSFIFDLLQKGIKLVFHMFVFP